MGSSEEIIEAEVVADEHDPGADEYAAKMTVAVRGTPTLIESAGVAFGSEAWASERQAAKSEHYRSQMTEEQVEAHRRVEERNRAAEEDERNGNTQRGFDQAEATWRRFLASEDGEGLPELVADKEALASYARWLVTKGKLDGTPYALETAKNRFGLTALWLRSVGGDADRDHTRPAAKVLKTAHEALAKAPAGRGQAPAISRTSLERCLATCGESLPGLRDRFLMLVSWNLAARSQEIANLTWSDIARTVRDDPEDGEYLAVTVRKAKTEASSRTVTMSGDVVRAFDRYRTALVTAGGSAAGDAPVFVGVTQHGRPRSTAMATKSVSDITTDAAAAAGLKTRYTSHSIRAGSATDMFARGFDVYKVAQLGGWAPNSTELAKYIRDAEELKDRADVRHSIRTAPEGAAR